MSREPSSPASSACSALVRTLDQWARDDEAVQAAIASLPRFDRHSAGHAAGLYVDDRRAPWMLVGEQLRFSLARVYSVTPRGVTLVAQVQVTALAPSASAGSRVAARVHFYVHETRALGTREVDSHEDMLREALEQHAEHVPRSDSTDAAYG